MHQRYKKHALLMVAERFPPDEGGVSRSAARLSRTLARLGMEIHVLAWTKLIPAGALQTIEDLDHDGTPTGVIIHRVGLFSNWDFSLQHTLNLLEQLHRDYAFSACWGHYLYPAGYLSVLFAETVGIPSTVSARGNDIDRLMFPPGDFARLMWTLTRATLITSVSNDLAKKIRVLLGRDANCAVLPNSVDAEVFCPATDDRPNDLRRELGIAPNETLLGFCGELRQKKGLPFLLAAFSTVQRVRPCRLLIIGSVRPREQAQLTEYSSDHPDAMANIRVTGEIESAQEIACHLQACDLILQPSVWDGMPNSVLEAMACGGVVLASDAGGIPEVIDHGTSGFLVPRQELARLGDAILEILRLPDEVLEAVRLAARRRIVDNFTLDDETERLKALLPSVLFPDGDGPMNSAHRASHKFPLHKPVAREFGAEDR